MKKIMIALFFVLLLSGCKSPAIETTEDLWNAVEENTYDNYDDDLGHGFYFFKEDNVEYCKYMVYDDDDEVLGFFDSEISYNEDLSMNIIIPETLINREGDMGTIRPVVVLLEYVDGTIVWNEIVFE